MKRTVLLFALLLALWGGAKAAPKVSVLTCGPGDDFYLLFGHSALRVQDTADETDYVYNYGTFDFHVPHFYLKFAQGQLNYCLSRTTYRHFIEDYRAEGRSVVEQELLLSESEAMNLALMLQFNYKPDYRYYRYDFFRDNCATRVRDMVERGLAHREASYAETDPMSYREAMLLHTASRPDMRWWTYGTNLLLGARTDRVASNRDLMYMPLLMHDALAEAQAGEERLCAPERQLLDEVSVARRAALPPVAAFAAVLAAVAVLTAMGRKRGWSLVWLDRLLFILAGLLGAFLLFMWLGTDHWCTKWNLNILWLSPLFLLLAIRPARCPMWSLWLQEAMLAAALIMSVAGWPQHIGLASAPLILALMLRVWVRIRVRD